MKRRQSRRRALLLATGAAFALTLAAGVFAHEDATGVVKERMEMMKDFAASLKVLVPMMQGKTGWDADAAAASAETIAGHAADLPDKFPEGSTGHPSEAREEIWMKWEAFEESAQSLAEHAAALEKAAGLGADAAKPLIGKIIQSCKSCHESFRVNKQ